MGKAVNRGRILPALEAVLAGLVLLWAHIALDVPAGRIPDYGRPDALFYTLGSMNLARGRGYHVEVNGRLLPPKFPPGTSLLLSPWYLLSGGKRESGITAVQILAVLLGGGVWWLGRKRAGFLGGFAALLALEGSFCFAAYRNQPVSEIPSALVVLLLFGLSTGADPGKGRIFLAGFLSGLASWFRYPLAILLPAPLLALEPWKEGGRRKVLTFAAGALLPLALLPAWHWSAFGSPFRTGYSLWLPGYHQGGRPLFSAAYALHGPAQGKPGEPNLPYYLSLLAGREDLLLPWPQALGVLAAFLFLLFGNPRRHLRKAALFAAFSLPAFLALFGLYYYQEARLLFPLAPLLAVLGAQGAAELGRRIARGREGPAGRVLAFLPLLLLAPASGWFFGRLTAERPARWARLDLETRRARTLARLVPPGSILATGEDILLLSGELPGRLLLPLSAGQEWAGALLYRDWKRKIRPGGTYEEFLRWKKDLSERSLPGVPGKDFLAPPAGAVTTFLERAARRGRPLFLDLPGRRKLPAWTKRFRSKPAGKGLFLLEPRRR